MFIESSRSSTTTLGVRGDFEGGVRAILMDCDARVGFVTSQGRARTQTSDPNHKFAPRLQCYFADSKYSVRNAYANLNEEAMHSPPSSQLRAGLRGARRDRHGRA